MGGRSKGTPNKRTQDIQEKLARIGCDPIRGMAEIALNRLPCGVCRGELKTKYKLPDGTHTPECRATTDAALAQVKRTGSNEEWRAARDSAAKCTCDGIGIRVCMSCYGSGWEACSPELRGKMYAEIAQYVLPKRKAIEHSGIDGEDIGVRLVVEFKE